MKIFGYELREELCRSEWHVLHRGHRGVDGRSVLIKAPRSQPARPIEIDLLKREATILLGLQLDGVPRLWTLECSDAGWHLVLEDRGGSPLRTTGAWRRTELDAFLRLAIGLATILAELHRRELIHQNINPRSILVHPLTGEICLGDFSLAVGVSGNGLAPPPPQVSRTTLTYLSPEQTGRMNRPTDYRTDFYSLGVTFYELLTGAPPFASDDPLELIHRHIAKAPIPPADINPDIPEVLSRIVMRLLAKTAEERYQSALGLRADLERCAEEWADKGRVISFPLGQRDVSDRFLIPQKLYGRSREVEALLRAFGCTCEGAAALMLVTGYAGIGKTSLIQELYRPIVRQRGYFVAGKFDQIVRNIPYGALIQAFRGLVQQLLTESEERLASWRVRLSEALGANGGVLTEVIPEFELILGPQPTPSSLGPIEAQKRFQLVLQSLVGAVGRKNHPLVVFLDDIQWADSATLSLLQPLLKSPDIRFLLLIGAYRENEVDGVHPLTRVLRLLESDSVQVNRIVLGPLESTDLDLLLRDALHREMPDVEPLAALVLRKTAGNPFFVLEFLKTLRRDGLIEFDAERGWWAFRMEAITSAKMTDNVIDLMTRKIQRLTSKCQRALTLAACIGTPFESNLLAIASGQSVEETADDLNEALGEGLLIPASGFYEHFESAHRDVSAAVSQRYAFLHDRVQQAAYSMIPEERRRFVHLSVGRLLLERWDPATIEERLFDVAHHLNHGSDLITDPAERMDLAHLNLRVGRKAKSSTAYQSAMEYFTTGLGLLDESSWETEYELALGLHLEAAESEYLCGEFEAAERRFERVLNKARTNLDKAKVYSLKILQYEHTSRYADAIRAGREGLALFGVTFPDSSVERQLALEAELAAIGSLLGGRSIDSLVDLPIMQDPEIRAVMRILSTMHTSCFLSGDKPLTLLNTATMVRLSLTHGNIAESAYAYALHAAMLEAPIRENYQAAYEFGTLALRLNERLLDPALRAKVLMMFAWAISLWRRPLEASFPITREAFRLAQETGLFVDAAWALFNEIWFAILTGSDLDAFAKAYTASVDYSARIRMPHIADAKRVLLQWGRALQGRTETPLSLTDASFHEDAYCRNYEGQRLFEMFYYVAKLAVLYTFGEYSAACETARKAELIIRRDFTGTIWDELRVFYHALSLSAPQPSGGAGMGGGDWNDLETFQRRLQWWAENSPSNFEAQFLIVSAEIARLHGKDIEAMTLYDAAIGSATSHQRLHERALANELYAKSWQERGQARLAAMFIVEARDCYRLWGAWGKVADLERRYAYLLSRDEPGEERGQSQVGANSTILRGPGEAVAGTLDMTTVTKAAQAITGEIELDKLLGKLMRIAIENAGAERACLLLELEGQSVLRATGSLDSEAVSTRGTIALSEVEDLPISLVQYVRRTSESVVLADARSDDRYGGDPYIRRRSPRSILCTPVLLQGRLIGILYLENNLAADAFTPDRIEIMQILASQAAISLENARLYDEMKQEVGARRKAEEELRAVVAEVEDLKNRLQAENVYLQEEIHREHNFVEMVGSSPALLAVLRKVDQVAPTGSTVLISGETGTGKELIARAIHGRSPRKDRPIVTVNCAAISAGLVESELFGHLKGAFTGALERRTGRFELADGGTIFLDEVGELPLETQVKMLRVLQDGEIQPVGSNKTVRVDVRVIAATNRDLGEAIREGRFRSDLFYRLNVFPLHAPSLRERLSDLQQLVMFFVSHFSRKFGKRIDAVTQETMDRMARYSWPGNIRELQNVVERAVILSEGPILRLGQDFGPADGDESRGSGGIFMQAEQPLFSTRKASATRGESGPAGFATLEEMERSHILASLERSGWVIEGGMGAARILNLHPNTLRSRMKKLGIRRHAHEMS